MKESLKGIADFLNNDGLRQAFNAVYRGKGTPLQKKIVFGIPALAAALVLMIVFVIIPLSESPAYTGEKGSVGFRFTLPFVRV